MKPKPRLYRPPNGTEGMMFTGRWCDNCRRDINMNCPIVADTMVFDIDDPEYPTEWRYCLDVPVCIKFIDRHASKAKKDPKQLRMFR